MRNTRSSRSAIALRSDADERPNFPPFVSCRGEMGCLETETGRSLFFDLLPLDVGVIGGFKTRLQLYTVPGQVFYNTTRKLVLKGVDGIVFVADSQRPM